MTGIKLGLQRITRLVQDTHIPWRAVHVAGTNGKGSVCNYTSHFLQASGVKCGMFTSPHLIDRWDCISLNGQPISKERFLEIENQVKARNDQHHIQATSFEILTATAFEAFTAANIEVAVVETGMGGLEDATNVIQKPTPAVITKLGLDHEDFLGKGIESIVNHKAGIMKHGSPCLIDGTNSTNVLMMLELKAKAREVKPFKVCHLWSYSNKQLFSNLLGWSDMPDHQKMHLILGYESAKIAIRVQKKSQPEWNKLLQSAIGLTVPGRQQSISIHSLTGRYTPVLLDGCHNEQSAAALKQTVDSRYREWTGEGRQGNVTWVLAASSKKDVNSIFGNLVREGDNVIITEFGPVDGMPWISPMPASEMAEVVAGYGPAQCAIARTVLDALKQATEMAAGRPLIIAGSLYLVSDILRLFRDGQSKEI